MQKCIKTKKKKIYIPYIHVQHFIFCFVIHINKSKLIKFIIIRISHKIYDISYALMYNHGWGRSNGRHNNTKQHKATNKTYTISHIFHHFVQNFFCGSFTLVLCRVVIFAFYNYSVPVFLFRICLCLLLLLKRFVFDKFYRCGQSTTFVPKTV